MKKFIVMICCLLAAFMLVSCDTANLNNDKENENADNKNPQVTADYTEILNLYKMAINACANVELTSENLGITDPQEKETFSDILWCVKCNYDGEKKADSTSPIYWLTFGYAVKDINGDGVEELVLLKEDYTILAIFSYVDGKPIMLGAFDYNNFSATHRNLTNCWIYGDGMIYTSDLSGFDGFKVYRIADGGTSLETVADYGWYLYYVDYTIGTVTKYYKCVDGQEIEINEDEYQALHEQYEKRLGSYSITEATKEYAGLDYIPLFSEAELIEEIYASALNNETKVYEVDTGEYKFLKACKTPYNQIRLSEVENLKYGYADLDGDGIGEPVIDCGDTIILRYYDGCVYSYSFTFRQMYYLKTDGSYAWNHTGQDFEYGEYQIYFEGAELKQKELYRIVNDGEPDVEYYIEGKQVSQEELIKYIEENPKTSIEYSPIDKSWYYRISSEEAYDLAIKYWRIKDEWDGACGSTIKTKVVVEDVPQGDDVYYHILKVHEYYNHWMEGWETRPPYNICLGGELLIDATTGECIEVTSEDYGKIYPSIAMDIASEYWDVRQLEVEINEETRIVSEIVISDFSHCDNKYYRVVYQREYYSYDEDSSENDLPYKVEIISEILVDPVTGEIRLE